jgi:uncharacterized RDD family membrane protein YckC
MDYVGVGMRAVATIVDLVVLFIIGYVIALATGQTTPGGFSLEGMPALLWFALSIAYYVMLEAQLGGTLGKLLLGLRVVKTDGSAVDSRAALIRTVLRIVDGLFFYLIAAILVWRSSRRQRLGDRVADTTVVRKSALATPA